jgi:hypothetical protein
MTTHCLYWDILEVLLPRLLGAKYLGVKATYCTPLKIGVLLKFWDLGG